MLEQVEAILSKAVDDYNILFTAGKWHVSNKSSGYFYVVYWNCEKEGRSLNKCSQPKDHKKIAAKKKKFSKQKRNSGGTNGVSKTSSSNESLNYDQNKWGA